MLTPLEIEGQKFSKSFRGYDKTEVKSFLNKISSDYEKTYRENLELKDKVEYLDEQLKQILSVEESIKKTLVLAQTTSDDLVKNAKNKAENMVKAAELEADSVLRNSKLELERIKEKYEEIKKEMSTYASKCEVMISSQLEFIKSRKEDLSFEERLIERKKEQGQLESAEPVKDIKDIVAEASKKEEAPADETGKAEESKKEGFKVKFEEKLSFDERSSAENTEEQTKESKSETDSHTEKTSENGSKTTYMDMKELKDLKQKKEVGGILDKLKKK